MIRVELEPSARLQERTRHPVRRKPHDTIGFRQHTRRQRCCAHSADSSTEVDRWRLRQIARRRSLNSQNSAIPRLPAAYLQARISSSSFNFRPRETFAGYGHFTVTEPLCEKTVDLTQPELLRRHRYAAGRKSRVQLKTDRPCDEQSPDQRIGRSNRIGRAVGARANSTRGQRESLNWHRGSRLRSRTLHSDVLEITQPSKQELRSVPDSSKRR